MRPLLVRVPTAAIALAALFYLRPAEAQAQPFSFTEVVNTMDIYAVQTPSAPAGFHFILLDSVPSISLDGRYVAFRAGFDMPNAGRGLFVADLAAPSISVIARTGDVFTDGMIVDFETTGNDLNPDFPVAITTGGVAAVQVTMSTGCGLIYGGGTLYHGIVRGSGGAAAVIVNRCTRDAFSPISMNEAGDLAWLGIDLTGSGTQYLCTGDCSVPRPIPGITLTLNPGVALDEDGTIEFAAGAGVFGVYASSPAGSVLQLPGTNSSVAYDGVLLRHGTYGWTIGGAMYTSDGSGTTVLRNAAYSAPQPFALQPFALDDNGNVAFLSQRIADSAIGIFAGPGSTLVAYPAQTLAPTNHPLLFTLDFGLSFGRGLSNAGQVVFWGSTRGGGVGYAPPKAQAIFLATPPPVNPPDAGGDGGPPNVDAGASDAGLADAGLPPDAGSGADAGPPDAGVSADAGVPPDAGSGVDAGLPDAGVGADAGAPPDAGSAADAGQPDAGVAADAGSRSDAGEADAGDGSPGRDGGPDGGHNAADAGLESGSGRGCGCGQASPMAMLWIAGLAVLAARRRRW